MNEDGTVPMATHTKPHLQTAPLPLSSVNPWSDPMNKATRRNTLAALKETLVMHTGPLKLFTLHH